MSGGSGTLSFDEEEITGLKLALTRWVEIETEDERWFVPLTAIRYVGTDKDGVVGWVLMTDGKELETTSATVRAVLTALDR